VFNPPQGFTGFAGYDSGGNNIVRLEWQAPEEGSSGNFVSYRIYRDETQISQIMDVNRLYYIDSTVSNGDTYEYTIVAVYRDINGTSEPVTTTVEIEPHVFNPPRNLSAVHDYDEHNRVYVNLQWELPMGGNSGILKGFKVNRDSTEIHDITNVNTLQYLDYGVTHSTSYIYTVTAVYDSLRGVGESDPVTVATPFVSDKDLVSSYSKNELLGNYPNPFNPTTSIKFVLVNNSSVTIDIYNVRGAKVKTLVNSYLNAGVYNLVWNGTNDSGQSVGSGVYFYRMKTDDMTSSKRMILMK
jgi:hypothetical protein